MMKKALSLLLACLLAVPAGLAAPARAADAASPAAPAAAGGDTAEAPSFLRYLDRHAEAARPLARLELPGAAGRALAEGEAFEAAVRVPQAGLYGLRMTYRVTDESTLNPTLGLTVNGEAPYSEAGNIQLSRLWKDAERGRRDKDGNERIPEQVEVREELTQYLSDVTAYYGRQLAVYLEAGENTVRLQMQRGTIQITDLALQNEAAPAAYDDGKGGDYPDYTGKTLYFEAENAQVKSHATIYGVNDANSPTVTPYDPYVTNLNTIGGTAWSSPGQFIEWTFDVPADGAYQLTIKSRQNVNIGLVSYRRILIDGEVPYAELAQFPFPYSNGYRNVVVGAADDAPYRLYLKAGRHTLRMEVDLGLYAEVLTYVQEILSSLNTAYRKIIMLTGVSPDSYRDYEIAKNLPDVMETFRENQQALEGIDAFFAKNMSATSSATKVIGTLSRQLAEFRSNPYRITARLSQFKSNITALSTWLMSARSQPLQIDYFALGAPGGEVKRAEATFWERLRHEATVFVHTFSSNYQANFSSGDKDRVTVWVSDGQVSMNAVQELLENDFKAKHDFEVDLKLVSASLLMAVVAGKGPDVALTTDSGEIMNYAYRDAVLDLARFPDLPQVLTRFRESAVIPLSYKDQVYGLPVNQTFYMLFYRKDVLAELGIAVPDTWQSMVSAMAALKKNKLEFGLPTDLMSYYMLLYQQGGTVYNPEGTATALTSNAAIHAFDDWCKFYTDYKLPIAFDAQNRFRTGEMPLMISSYATFNELSIAAPEIQGQWGMTLVPGTEQADGSIDRSVVSTIGASLILRESARGKEEQCWEFLKWWTSADIQQQYARRKELVLGPSARSTTANIEAFRQLPWDKADLDNLLEQASWTRGVPGVPGSYYTSRHLSNALNKVLYASGTPSEELTTFSQIIDKEITKKRKELGLDRAQG